MTDFATLFQFPAFFSIRGKINVIIYFNDGMDREKIFPTDLLLLTQVVSSVVVRIAWHRKVYRKTITTKYSLNNWGIDHFHK